jgi:hypothetical protein
MLLLTLQDSEQYFLGLFPLLSGTDEPQTGQLFALVALLLSSGVVFLSAMAAYL